MVSLVITIIVVTITTLVYYYILGWMIQEQIPFGLIADKMTVHRRTRHILGIKIPIWDMENPRISKDVYLRHAVISDATGDGVSDHMISTLENFGFKSTFIREYMSGMAMDDQYTKLGIQDHMKAKLKIYKNQISF